MPLTDHKFRYSTSHNPLHLCQEWGDAKARSLGLRSMVLLGSNGGVRLIEVRAGNAEEVHTLAIVTHNETSWWPCLVGSEVVEKREDLTKALDRACKVTNNDQA